MRFRWRKNLLNGPLRVTASDRGLSWGVKLGNFLSWSAKTGKTTVNTPGPGSVEFGGRKRGRRER